MSQSETLERALNAAEDLVTRGGLTVATADRDFWRGRTAEMELQGDAVRLRSGNLHLSADRLGQLGDSALYGFFDAAADGVVYVPLNRVRERFGRKLEENYPEAGHAFLSFARTYWTLKLLVDELDANCPGYLVRELLEATREMIGPLFFPMPGPVHLQIDPAQRERDQREMLKECARRIDVEDFIKNNPILQRDRRARRGGCMSMLIVLTALAFLTSIHLWR